MIAVQLYQKIQDDKVTKAEKDAAIADATSAVIPMLGDKNAANVTAIIGTKGENILPILDMVVGIGKLFEKKTK